MHRFIARMLGSAAFTFAALLIPFAGAKALTISPPYFDYSLNPGDTVLDVIKIYNEDPFPITIFPVVTNFTFTEDEEGGTPKFYPADEDPAGTALAKWITVGTEPMTIAPGERANVPFSLTVPKDQVQPGGHFGAILLSTGAPKAEGPQVGITSQIASLIFVRVSGEVKEQGSIAEFGFKTPQVWYNYLPVDFFLRFENSGNTHLRPTGNLFIKNWWGRQSASIKVNDSFSSVLPLSIRRFEFGWRHTANPEGASFTDELRKEWRNFALGKYTAMLVLNYGSTNQIVTDSRVFYVWPWRLLIVFGAAALFAVIFFTALMKIYNRAVIRKYELEKAKRK